MSYRAEFHPPNRLLLGPGPSPVEPRVLRALSAPVLGHLDPLFLQCMDDIQQMLRDVFETKNEATFPVSGTGSAAMEMAFVNLVEPGDEVVIFVAGYFSERMAEIARRCGGQVHAIPLEWGQPVRGTDLAAALEQYPETRVVGVVHAETSTGARTPLDELHEVLDGRNVLLVVDAVTSLGTLKIGVDENGVDVCFSCTQKGLGCPPGLGPITFSPRALQKIKARRTGVQSWYYDISLLDQYWGEGKSQRAYHHTAPISMNYALREGLRIVLEEGFEARLLRHEQNHLALVAGLEAMGLEVPVDPAYRVWALTTVRIPKGIDDLRIRQRLLQEFNLEIGGGLGPLKGQIWRIGLMGAGSTRGNVLLVLSALESVLREEGFEPAGSGVAAANDLYAVA